MRPLSGYWMERGFCGGFNEALIRYIDGLPCRQ